MLSGLNVIFMVYDPSNCGSLGKDFLFKSILGIVVVFCLS